MKVMENLLVASLANMTFADLRLADAQLAVLAETATRIKVKAERQEARLMALRHVVRRAMVDKGVRPDERGDGVVRLWEAMSA